MARKGFIFRGTANGWMFNTHGSDAKEDTIFAFIQKSGISQYFSAFRGQILMNDKGCKVEMEGDYGTALNRQAATATMIITDSPDTVELTLNTGDEEIPAVPAATRLSSGWTTVFK